MEIQIQDLVQSIKKDGIEEARKQADEIVAAAKVQAQEIVAASKAEAAKNIENAEREIESTKALIKQAERDAVLSVKKELENMLGRIMAEKVSAGLSDESLAKLILAALNGEDPAAYAVEIGEAKASLKGALAAELKKGLEIRPVKGNVMRLVSKDGSGFFDLSDAEIAALLKPFLGEMKI
ncbi:MAG: V-type ATP synthase subunit E [Spirochaetales bacterium]|nr:V-type ATP synthase subunit E [Spirochaetales bacterium]